jgi:hypothetical protein
MRKVTAKIYVVKKNCGLAASPFGVKLCLSYLLYGEICSTVGNKNIEYLILCTLQAITYISRY